MREFDDDYPTRVIVRQENSSAFGVASFILGLISIFFMAPVFVPLAFLTGIVALFRKQVIWPLLGFGCAIIGAVTSPILWGFFAAGLLALHFFTIQPTLPTHSSAFQHREVAPTVQISRDPIKAQGSDLQNLVRDMIEGLQQQNAELDKWVTETAPQHEIADTHTTELMQTDLDQLKSMGSPSADKLHELVHDAHNNAYNATGAYDGFLPMRREFENKSAVTYAAAEGVMDRCQNQTDQKTAILCGQLERAIKQAEWKHTAYVDAFDKVDQTHADNQARKAGILTAIDHLESP